MSSITAAAETDRAMWSILFGNLCTLAIAWWQEWGMLALLWPFWIQSVVIGYFHYRRIQALRQFSTEGFRINGRAVEPTPQTQRQTALFFALHFGLFHAVYLVFLLAFTGIVVLGQVWPDEADSEFANLGSFGWLDALIIPLLGGSFWLSHKASFAEHLEGDRSGRPNIGTLLFLPYLRVLPMHVMLILGVLLGGKAWSLLLFGALKIVADIGMHKVEHRLLRRPASA